MTKGKTQRTEECRRALVLLLGRWEVKLESSQRWITQHYLSSPASSEYPADGTGPVGVGSSTLEVWHPGEVQTLTWQWVCGDKRGRETRWSDFPRVTWGDVSPSKGERRGMRKCGV